MLSLGVHVCTSKSLITYWPLFLHLCLFIGHPVTLLSQQELLYSVTLLSQQEWLYSITLLSQQEWLYYVTLLSQQEWLYYVTLLSQLAQTVVDAGAIAHLASLISSSDAKLKRQVYSALSQISKHSVDLAEMVVEAEIFPAVLTSLRGNHTHCCCHGDIICAPLPHRSR